MTSADGSPKRRTTAARLVWLAIIGLLLTILTDSHATASKVDTTVVYVVDVSDSISNSEKEIDYVLALINLRRSKDFPDWNSLIVFGKNAAVEIPPSRSFPFEKIYAQVDRGGTNLEQAVSMAAAVIKPEGHGRIVLISDGVQTDGDVAAVLPALKPRQIRVDVRPIEYSYDREVWLEGIELPQQAEVGKTYDVWIRLSSLASGRGSLTLNSEGHDVAQRQIEFQAGENRYSLPLTITSNGYQEYTASIDVPPGFDYVTQNNSVLDFIYVGGQGKILIVTGKAGENVDASIFEKSIRSAGHKVDVIDSSNLPAEARLLIPYDAIIFCNVARHELTSLQLQAVCDAVKDTGTGFLMTGGQNSFGPGGYDYAPIKNILPVSMSGENLASGALVIILDNCNMRESNTWAKRVTKQAISALDPANEFGIIARSDAGDPKWLIELTSAKTWPAALDVINGANIENLHSFRLVLEMALERLEKRESNSKHILVLSDGTLAAPPSDLIDRLVAANVSVSVAITGDSPRSSKRLALAETTGGTCYEVDHPHELTAIFVNEAQSLKRGFIRKKEFAPAADAASSITADIGPFPNLTGYVATAMKGPPAIGVLTVPPEPGKFDSLTPILAVWPYGQAKVAAFTSNFSDWGDAWQKWDGLPNFVQRLVSEISRDSSLGVSTHVTDRAVAITVKDLRPGGSDQPVEATLIGPDRKLKSTTLKRTRPNQFQGTFPLWGYGRYQVLARRSNGDAIEAGVGGFGFVESYSPEHLQLHSDRAPLDLIASQTGGRILTNDVARDAVFDEDRLVRRTSYSSFDWMLIALALSIPLVELAKRLAIQISRLRDLATIPDLSPNPTLAALLKTKRWVNYALSHKGSARLLVQIWSPAPRPKSKPKTKPPDSEDSQELDLKSPKSTIEKLLAVKAQQLK